MRSGCQERANAGVLCAAHAADNRRRVAEIAARKKNGTFQDKRIKYKTNRQRAKAEATIHLQTRQRTAAKYGGPAAYYRYLHNYTILKKFDSTTPRAFRAWLMTEIEAAEAKASLVPDRRKKTEVGA